MYKATGMKAWKYNQGKECYVQPSEFVDFIIFICSFTRKKQGEFGFMEKRTSENISNFKEIYYMQN